MHFIKTHFLILVFISLFYSLQGQTEQNPSQLKKGVKGYVTDNNSEEALEFASLVLYRLPDSSAVGGGFTDDKGFFAIQAESGNYLLQIEYLGYEVKKIPFELSEAQALKELGNISIIPSQTMLDEVEITAEKNLMQIGLDKKIYNVSQGLARTGGSAAEVLDNIPSVTVDLEGNVSLRGNSGVRLLVDGKPSGLLGINTGLGLQQLPANMIERIEVVNNPSVRYEAEGTAGVINIVLKKEKKKGWNGAFEATAGYPHRYNGSVNLNFRRKKINFFTNLGLTYRKSPGRGYSYRENIHGDTTDVLEQNQQWTRGGLSSQFRFGADYFLDAQNTLTASIVWRRGTENNLGEIESLYYPKGQPVETISLRSTDEIEKERNLDYSLNYARTFKRKGQKLTADVIYNSNGETEAMDVEENFSDSDYTPIGTDPLYQRINNKENESKLILQSDYIHPFGKEGSFEAGYRGSIREITNDYKIEEYDNEMDEWKVLTNLSNEFVYNENIQAMYALMGNKKNRLSYQLGLRAEYTDVKTHLIQTSEQNRKQYTNLFPSGHLGWELNEKSSVQASYSRRVRRPRFRDLNPFFSYSNPYSIRSGNPDLDPEFTHSMEIGYLAYWGKANLSTSLYYRHTDGVIQWLSTVDEDGITHTMPQNLTTRDDIGAELTLSVNLKSWWKLDGGVNFFKGWVNGENLGTGLQSDFFSWTGKVNSRMTLGKDFDIQFMINYRGPEKTVQGRRLEMVRADFAMSKDVLKGKGTLNFRISDVFNTRMRRGESSGEDFYLYSERQWRQRQFILSFVYRLNQNKKREKGGVRMERGGDSG